MAQKETRELGRASHRPDSPGDRAAPAAEKRRVAPEPGSVNAPATPVTGRCPPGAFVYVPPHLQPEPTGGQKLTVEGLSKQIVELTEEVKQLRVQLSDVQGTGGLPEGQGRADVRYVEPEEKNKVLNVISNVFFYLVIIALVAGAVLIKSSSGGRPIMLAGYSAFRVLTSSMEDVYPKGSLIISKSVDTNELVVGDDITFMVGETSSVTHRIIGITRNYLGTGKPGFETKGVMNEKPDKEIVASANVVGKVVFCSKELGTLAYFVKNNWPIILFVVCVMMALFAFLKWNAQRGERETSPPPPKPPPKNKSTARHVKK